MTVRQDTALETLLAEVAELDKKATPGPWKFNNHPYLSKLFHETGGYPDFKSFDDAHFIAAARTLLPKLAEALKVASAATYSSMCRCERIDYQSPGYRICRRCYALAELERIVKGTTP